ncbi:MAG TPA: zinc ribbon domain-containing protein, partial [Thermoplasmata archaeon]|nr:zinc ribbon domain-containing protein [Thermoplasmata archaeon]
PSGIAATFEILIEWSPGAGVSTATQSVTVVPAFITLTIVNAPSGTVVPNTNRAVSGTVSYYGNTSATINVTAYGPGGIIFLGSESLKAGNYSVSLFFPTTIPAGTYGLNVSVTHDGGKTYQLLPQRFTIASTSSSSSTPWYLMTLFGLLPIWLLIVIAIAAVGLVLGVFVISARQARGKLVECGECGELIPESALTCPKCGAEFEAALVRCSRCGSTIPGTSKVCPECSATLLGPQADEKADPERQGYADFVERFRTESKKELGENYNESAFWDWWKRQQTYVSFSQWRLQQSQSSRAGMTAPRESTTPLGKNPPGGAGALDLDRATTSTPPRPPARPAPGAPPPAAPRRDAAPAASAAPASTPPAAGMITCPNCQKEVPSDYYVCPFCGAVTQ